MNDEEQTLIGRESNGCIPLFIADTCVHYPDKRVEKYLTRQFKADAMLPCVRSGLRLIQTKRCF